MFIHTDNIVAIVQEKTESGSCTNEESASDFVRFLTEMIGEKEKISVHDLVKSYYDFYMGGAVEVEVLA